MNLCGLTKQALRERGYDGLCNPYQECGCALDDLIPCGCPEWHECIPGYFRRRIGSCSCGADTEGADPCICTRPLEWWEHRGFARNPVEWFKGTEKPDGNYRSGAGFYFWEETWMDVTGPFPSHHAARAELYDYLEGEAA